MEVKRHELYEDIKDHIIDTMRDYLIEELVAEQVAVAIIHRLSSHWRQYVFLSKGYRLHAMPAQHGNLGKIHWQQPPSIGS
jgi:hypothetical protein